LTKFARFFIHINASLYGTTKLLIGHQRGPAAADDRAARTNAITAFGRLLKARRP
jgi:hypothetical protein